MKHPTAEQLFAEVHRLHRFGHNNSQIAKALHLRRATVVRWLSLERYGDKRGWRKGQPRKHTDPVVAERICQLKRHRLEANYLVGSEYVQMDYCRTYAGEDVPPISFIKRVVHDAALQSKKPKGKRRGGSVYLLYPKASLNSLGVIQQSADFIGKKYLEGPSRPITIFSSCYYRPFKMYQIQRTESEKAVFAIDILIRQWAQFPMPHVFRMDNGGPFRGTGHSVRRLGSFVLFLLNLGIIPLFASPSRPWTNGAIEGHNRIFTEKVWSRNHFSCVEEIDRENERFNREGRDFFHYRYHNIIHRFRTRLLHPGYKIDFETLRTRRGNKIIFIRFVQPSIDEPRDHIVVMNERVFIPEEYTHQFVFATWDLTNEELSIVSEYQGTCSQVCRIPFKINS